MARLTKSILGDFAGKVGNIVGSSWRSTAYIRSLPSKVRDPRTPQQQAVRKMMRNLSVGLRPLLPALRFGYPATGRISAWNAALVKHYRTLFGNLPTKIKRPEDVPDFDIERDVILTNGTLTFPIDISPGRDGAFSLTWQEPQEGTTFYDGKIYFAAINTANNRAVFFSIDADSGTASVSTASILLGTDDDYLIAYAFIATSKEASVANMIVG